jgi:hypothetical protein
MEGGSSGVVLGLSLSLSLAISSLVYAPYLLVSLGGIVDNILGVIMILLVAATTIVAVEYCSCSMVLVLSVW